MPKKGQRKCKLCGNYIIDMTDAVEYKGGYVHSDCFAISIKAIQNQRTQKEEERESKKKQSKSSKAKEYKIPKQGLSEEEYAEKQNFFNSLKKIMKVDKLPAKVYPIIEKMMKQYPDFTYPNMLLTLEYCQEQDMDMGDNCLGLIPYYYDAALAESKLVKEAQQNIIATMNLMDDGDINIVKVNPVARKKKNKLIDIEGIGNQDEGN